MLSLQYKLPQTKFSLLCTGEAPIHSACYSNRNPTLPAPPENPGAIHPAFNRVVRRVLLVPFFSSVWFSFEQKSICYFYLQVFHHYVQRSEISLVHVSKL